MKLNNPTAHNLILVIVVLLLWGKPAESAVIHIGTFGQIWPIAEPDALKELRQRAARIDWGKIFSKDSYKTDLREYRPEAIHLPRVEQSRTRQVAMTYTLPFDIPDGKGGILYPKGYTYNPLDYMPFSQILVVIDGTDPDQVAWFEASEYAGTPRVMLLLSAGGYSDVRERLGQPVFYASADIVDRFELRAVPSVICQQENQMEVKEIVIPNRK